ncbi:MAG: acyl--CoA ligase, partial [Clostridia bacterium]|nr:acyl--CoA ligase [Clostridia bacterium]
MVITELLERNARLYGPETALVEINPSEARDRVTTWREASLIEGSAEKPYRTEISWAQFDRMANRFANLLLSRNIQKGDKVGILMMNCMEWLPVYFGVLKAGAIAVPLNFRYAADEIRYCVDLADVSVLVFGTEFTERIEAVLSDLKQKVKMFFFVGKEAPAFAERYLHLLPFCSSQLPPVALTEEDDAAIYFSSGTTGFPKAILHNHRALISSCRTEQNHHGQTRDDVFLCIPPLYHTG